MSISFNCPPETVVKAMQAQVQNDLKAMIYREVEGMARPIIEKIAKDIAEGIQAKMHTQIDYAKDDQLQVMIAFNGKILEE